MGEAGAVGEAEGAGVGDIVGVGDGSAVGASVARGKVGAIEGTGLLLATGGWAVGMAGCVGVDTGGVEQPTRTSMTITSSRCSRVRFILTLSHQACRRGNPQGSHRLNPFLARSVHGQMCTASYSCPASLHGSQSLRALQSR